MIRRYEQVALEFSTLISQGVLRPGDRIPSVRKACQQYRVNAGTILQAYGQLEARGLINARPRSGYYVLARKAGWAPEPAITSPHSGSTRVDVANLVFKVLASIRDREIVPLGSAFPSPELFPLEKLNKIAAAVARRMPTWSSIHDLTPGNAELRRLIGLRYLESGLAISAGDIVITSGANDDEIPGNNHQLLSIAGGKLKRADDELFLHERAANTVLAHLVVVSRFKDDRR